LRKTRLGDDAVVVRDHLTVWGFFIVVFLVHVSLAGCGGNEHKQGEEDAKGRGLHL